MGKTITVRMDDATYEKIKSAAEAERRTISNYMEYATLAYLENSAFVSDEEMKEILDDKELVANLKKALEEVERGDYKIVE